MRMKHRFLSCVFYSVYNVSDIAEGAYKCNFQEFPTLEKIVSFRSQLSITEGKKKKKEL